MVRPNKTFLCDILRPLRVVSIHRLNMGKDISCNERLQHPKPIKARAGFVNSEGK